MVQYSLHQSTDQNSRNTYLDMNKLTTAAKDLYQECYRAIEAFKNGNILESTLPMKPTRIPAAIFKNIQAFNNRRYNDTLSQYYYLGLAHRYLEKEEGLSPKEIRALSDLTRREYMTGQFLAPLKTSATLHTWRMYPHSK